MKIDFNQVLHYLEYRNQKLSESNKRIIDDCISEINGIVREKYVYDFFDIKQENGKIVLQNSTLALSGRDIENHLKNCLKCVVMAATLGIEVDKRIAFYSKMDLSKGIIMDACASAAIEALCDNVENQIRAKVSHERQYMTSRYSPGYGDFPLELQHDIISVLDAYRQIGLSVTENSLLIPRKSVTAVIGIRQIPSNNDCHNEKCTACDKIDCRYRRGDCEND
jgi:cobalamin-dependent methionine synthase I